MKTAILVFAVFAVLLLGDEGAAWWRRRRRTPPPKVHCSVSSWGSWSSCSKTCDKGTRYRKRSVTRHPQHGGSGCPSLSERQYCNVHCCRCEVSAWGSWQPCSASCGQSTRARTRKIIKQPSRGCGSCGHLTDRATCKRAPCPCVTSSWSAWGTCSKSCDGGKRKSTRTMIKHPQAGAPSCPLDKTENCNIDPCPCEVSDWGNWEQCSEECGPGRQERSRQVLKYPSPGGLGCEDLEQERACEVKKCPIHCEMGEWTIFQPCSVTCGNKGVKKRRRAVLVEPKYDGDPCGNKVDMDYCLLPPCPGDCQVSAWSKWGPCKTSGKNSCSSDGKKLRKRTITRYPSHGGKLCPPVKESQKCNIACPPDCKLSQWSEWSECKAKCGKQGKMYRKRTLSAKKGADCPAPLKQSKYCVHQC